MEPLLTAALNDSCDRLLESSRAIPVNDLNESVFRYFFAEAVINRAPSTQLLFECNRIDLVVRTPLDLAFLEFKYYIHSPAIDPCTFLPKNRKKGYPSEANVCNFKKSIEILRRRECSDEVRKYVVLFYEDPEGARGRTYDLDYADVHLDKVLRISQLLSPIAFSCLSTRAKCTARLYAVQA